MTQRDFRPSAQAWPAFALIIGVALLILSQFAMALLSSRQTGALRYWEGGHYVCREDVAEPGLGDDGRVVAQVHGREVRISGQWDLRTGGGRDE